MALGPVTESRFEEAFHDAAVVSRKLAARLLGIDEKTLIALTLANAVRSVPRGRSHRGYTERDLRAYLTESSELPFATAESKPRAKSPPRPHLRVMNFSERRRGKA